MPLSTQAPPCADVNLIGVAGSGELDSKATSGTDNMGQTVTDLSDKLEKSYAGSATTYSKHGVQYTAISVMKVLQNLRLYQPSVDDGVKKLNAYLSKFLNGGCAGSVVLAGYSQGADVVMRSYHALDPKLQPRVKAVTLFGDPYFNPYAPYDRGSFDIRPDGVGFLGVRVNEGTDFAAKAHSYCLYKDPVCNSSSNPVTVAADWKACKDNAAGKPVDCPHFDYRNGWTFAAAEFVNSLLPPIAVKPVLDHIAIWPNPATITAGTSQSYTAAGYDAANNTLGMVTSSTTFSIAPEGSCTGSVCTANTPGTHTVTGTTNGVSGTAVLNVQAVPTNLAGVRSVAVGGLGLTAFAVKTDGTVWAWGAKGAGLLGSGTASDSMVPVQVAGLTGVEKVRTDGSSAFAVKTDGTVWAWGSNSSGVLGNGTTTDSGVPRQVKGLTGVVDVTTDNGYSVHALRSDGTVWSWGSNLVGELGDGTTTDSSLPVQAAGLTGIQKITSDSTTWSVYALRSDGTVWTWGDNHNGQLGNGTTTNSSVPTPVSGLADVKNISVNLYSVVALRTDGTVWTWGLNRDGQLGNGTTTNSTVPVQATGLAGVQSVVTNESSTYALMPDGTVWSWGRNNWGQLGNGTAANAPVPAQIPNLDGVHSLTVDFLSAHVVRADGTVWSWGLNNNGQLGNGNTTSSAVPVQARNLSGVQDLSADHSVFALMPDGTLWSWGANGSGQLGIGTTSDSSIPVQVG
ncbi:cutinase family protein [Pseudarthrobacter phenanthrenivorans]|uniref:RCC1 domain-containing protein n=1 Tax=Pseudarthrobacter phenanthrenivorans TaxID=361575 RepID=UPI00344D174C